MTTKQSTKKNTGKKTAAKRTGPRTAKKATPKKSPVTRKQAASRSAPKQPATQRRLTTETTSTSTSRASRAKEGKTGPKRISLLDAAAQVLAGAKEPMNCRQIVDEVLKRTLWTTKGKTPHQTLHAAIIREIQKQGKKSRFKKTGRGRFNSSS